MISSSKLDLQATEAAAKAWGLLMNKEMMDRIKGQLVSKTNCRAEDSPKKGTNEFVFTSMRCDFVCFFGMN